MIWPKLQVGENEFKPLHECNRAETIKLHDRLTEQYMKLLQLNGYMTVKRQLQTWIKMTESRLAQYEMEVIKDPVEDKPQKPRVRLLDD